jgi:phosphatidylglycerol---prolipoprotein diacylglyceryl transferase
MNYIHWNVNPEIINFLGISIRYYGLLFVGGLILCLLLLGRIFDKEQIPPEHLEKLALYGIIGIFAGARLGHCLFYEPEYYLHHIVEMLLPIKQLPGGGFRFIGYQGLASHGGTLGLMIALVIYTLKTKEPLTRTLDLIAVVAALGACFIRLANLMNSEIIGIPTHVPWAFVFVREDNLPRHPAQLYEALAYLLIFGLMMSLYRLKKKRLQHGFYFGLVLVLIFVARFFIEFVKEKQVSVEAGMHYDLGQRLSIPFILLGLGFVIYGLIRTRYDKDETDPERIPC